MRLERVHSAGGHHESVRLTVQYIRGARIFPIVGALVEFKEDKTIATPPGPETEITVVALWKPAERTIRLKRVHEWAQFSNTASPAQRLRRERVRKKR